MVNKTKLSTNNKNASLKRWEKQRVMREKMKKANDARMKKRAEQREKGVEQDRSDEESADEAAATAPSSSNISATTRHEECRQRIQRKEQELRETRRQLEEQEQQRQMTTQQLNLKQGELELVRQQLHELQQQTVQDRIETEQAQQQLEQRTQELEMVRQQLHDHQQTVQDRIETEQARQQLHEQQQQAEQRYRQRIHQLESSLVECRTQNADLEHELDIAQIKLDQIRRQLPVQSGRKRVPFAELTPRALRERMDQFADQLSLEQTQMAAHRMRQRSGDATPETSRMSPKDALLVLAQIGTWRGMRRLKRTLRLINPKFDVLPSTSKFMQLKAEITANINYMEVTGTTGTGLVCTNIREAPEFRLKNARNNLSGHLHGKIVLHLTGDHGQECIKISIGLGQSLNPNSHANLMLVALYPGQDDRQNLELFCAPLWPQIDGLITLKDGHGTERQVVWFLGGDIAFLFAILGHCGSAVTTFPSPVCECAKNELLTTDCQPRTIDRIIANADHFAQAQTHGQQIGPKLRAESKGITCQPLIRTIPVTNVLLAPFHVMQGITNSLLKELEKEDRYGGQRVLEDFLHGIGARKEAFRKQDFTGNTIRIILKRSAELEQHFVGSVWAQTICRAMSILRRVQDFMEAKILSEYEISQLQIAIDDFRHFVDHTPRLMELLKLKPKVHLLVAHFLPFVEQHKFLGLLFEQGIEAMHPVIRRLEQHWKTMPDTAGLRMIGAYHFLVNWMFDTGRLAQMAADHEYVQMDMESDDENEMDDANFEDVGNTQ